ncbi:MAG: sterol desaturase family protein [Bryobacteraceae bacterium]|nr:sterol desaturase family protein [Bryobacteraceae bacterium]
MTVRLWVYGPLVACAWWLSVRSGAVGASSAAAYFAAGVALWTALEYLMHRYAFHGFAPHYEHHRDPADRRHILAPLWLSLSGAGALWLLLWPATGSAARAALIATGVIAGYLGYELIHLRLHSGRRGGRILRALRKRHFHHHFADERVCYGVTSPLWDVVFGTLPAEPRRLGGARDASSEA